MTDDTRPPIPAEAFPDGSWPDRASEINALHDRAMALADEADLARRDDDQSFAADRSEKAGDLEALAAAMSPALSLTRSVLFRSAAWLAIDAKMHNYAAWLAAGGMFGCPSAEILQALRKVRDRAHELGCSTCAMCGVSRSSVPEETRKRAYCWESIEDAEEKPFGEIALSAGRAKTVRLHVGSASAVFDRVALAHLLTRYAAELLGGAE